jgi:hypothetical protein
VSKATPAARALVGCLALADGVSLNEAIRLSGYSITSADRVAFHKGRCEHREEGTCGVRQGWRVVVRNGRIAYVSRSGNALMRWMLRLGKKLAVIAERAGRKAA